MKINENKFLLDVILFFLGFSKPAFAQNAAGADIGATVSLVPLHSFFLHKDYFVCCGSLIKGQNKKYHLKGKDRKYWDRAATHHPNALSI